MSDETTQQVDLRSRELAPSALLDNIIDQPSLGSMNLMVMLLATAIDIKGSLLVATTNEMKENADAMTFWGNYISRLPIPRLGDGKKDPSEIERMQEEFKVHQEMVTGGENNLMSGRQEGENLSAAAQGDIDGMGQQCSQWASIVEKLDSIIRALKDMTRRG